MIRWAKATAKRFLRRTCHRVIVPFTPAHHFFARLLRSLKSQRIDCVLDVGACTGEYASFLLSEGFTGRVISFEPIEAVHRVLCQRAATNPRWVVAPRCALGAESGEAVLHVSQNLASSSLLEMHAQHTVVEPNSTPLREERVVLRRLDEVAPPLLGDSSRLFLKIDVQGFEPQVLEGAAALMPRIHGLQIEMSLVELYRGQLLFPDLMQRVLGLGFVLWGFDTVFVDEQTGRTLQVDGVFFRPAHGAVGNGRHR